MEQGIVIQKKKKTAAVIFAAVFLLALSGIAIWVLTSFVYTKLPGFLKLKIAAVIVISGVTLIAVFFLLKHSFSKKPGLIIDEHGITDHSNITSVGFISWDDITAVKQTQNAFKQKLLILMVSNPDSYIYKDKTMQAGRKSQHLQFGSPIVVTVGNLEYDTEKLISLISDRITAK